MKTIIKINFDTINRLYGEQFAEIIQGIVDANFDSFNGEMFRKKFPDFPATADKITIKTLPLNDAKMEMCAEWFERPLIATPFVDSDGDYWKVSFVDVGADNWPTVLLDGKTNTFRSITIRQIRKEYAI